MRDENYSLGKLARSLAVNRELLIRLAKREYAARFRGSIMGLAWAVLTPLALAIAYTFVFAGVFKLRWVGGDADAGPSFAVNLIVGLAIHGMFAECLGRAPNLIVSSPSYVTKVVFPLEILSFTILLPAIVTAIVTLIAVVIINFALTGRLNATLLLCPFVLGPYALFIAALIMIVSAVGVFLRDLTQIVGLIIPLSLFLSPVMYPIDAVPPAIRHFMMLNPLTFPIEQLRLIILAGKLPDWAGLAIYALLSLAALALAYGAFQRLRKGFSDVI